MGNGSILKCHKCNKEYNLFLGNGMFSFCEEQLFDFTQKGGNIIDRSKDNKILNLDELQQFLKLKDISINKNFGNECYYCDNCKNFEIRFYYYLKSGNKVFRPKYKCERCDSILNHTPKKNINYSHYCKKCNIPMENTGFIVNWD